MGSALLIIDVQKDLFDLTPRPADADMVIARINELASRARHMGMPVVFVQHETKRGELEYGSPGWDLEAQLTVDQRDHKIRKTTPDSFLRTRLGELLSSLNVSQVIICGYASEFCVDTTVRRAAALGYEVVLVSDAHTTHDKAHANAVQIREHHNATLPNITSFGPRIRALKSSEVEFGA